MTSPIRVAHVVSTVGATGVEAFLLTLLASFDRARVAPVLFVPHEGVLAERARQRGIAVAHGAPTHKLDLDAPRRLAGLWGGRFDVVHAHGPRAAFWAERAARRSALPCVVTVHELRWQTMPPGLKRELWIALEASVLRGATWLTTVSGATRRDLLARYPGLAARTSVVHASTPWLLEPEALPSARPFASPGSPLRLVTIGRFSWQKGYDLLFESLARLSTAGVEWSLEIVGHGVEETQHRAHAARLGIAHRVSWLGRDADVPARLAAADAFVTTTRGEMFGIAVLEAMAVGVPVLATAVGSLLEVVDDGGSGTLVRFAPEATLPQRFAAELERWALEPDLPRRMGEVGRRRAREAFGPTALARGMSEVYERLLERTDR